MVGMAIIGMSLILLWTGTAEAVLGFSLALPCGFACQSGGGIYTKTADIAADLSAKWKLYPGRRSPKPGCSADNVGDNVGDSGRCRHF